MMDWFQKNRWLGTFLIVLAGAILLSLIFLFMTRSSYEEAFARFNEAAIERNRLERLDPFPNDANYKEMKVHIENYRTSLDKFKSDLMTHVLPMPPQLAPNEFQTRLRQAITTASDKARLNKVRLPENFFLGFDQFTAALPDTAAAPLLGQELSQIQLLANLLIEARVDSVAEFKRTPLASEGGAQPIPAAAPGKKPAGPAATGRKELERAVVDLKFSAVPSVARKVINQIAGANEQFYIIRTLYVRNEKDKGPTREQTGEGAPAAAQPAAPAAKPPGALNFIVGNEHIEVAAQIEIVRFTY
ncbi:MAG: Amuc_1100 family pilus-like protein [Verrucomicrobiota bacterium]